MVATLVIRYRKSSGRPSATVTDATPLVCARVSWALRTLNAAFAPSIASSGSGAEYRSSDSNPRWSVAVARTRSSVMPLRISNGVAIAT